MRTPACSVILEDNKPCGRRPAAGNPPQCAQCIADLQEQDTMAFIENLGPRVESVFERARKSMPQAVPPAFRRGQPPPQRPPQPAPRTAPPPPPKPSPEVQKQAALRIFGWSSTFKFTAEDVKKRKKALATVYHSDAVGTDRADQEMMQRINAASAILLKTLS